MSFIIENGVLKKYIAEPSITRVEIPEGVTEIDNFAFSDWKEIKEIILPDSITELKGQELNSIATRERLRRFIKAIESCTEAIVFISGSME